jgi:homoserine O-acetyltransferase
MAYNAPLPSPYHFYRGGEIVGGQIAYETWGTLNQTKSNSILIFTGLSPSAHAASSPLDRGIGWWEQLIGQDATLDTNHYHIICVNSVGSCFGSSGPNSIDPVTGARYGNAFPDVSIEDVAAGGRAVLDHLGIERAALVIGPSLGGSAVLAFAALHPGRTRRLISISGTMAASAHAIALRSIQREAVRNDPINGLRLARKLGTVTYRSAAELTARFGRAASNSGQDFAVQDYIDQQADKFSKAFDPDSYLRLSRAIDLFDLSAHGDPKNLFHSAGIESALVIGVEQDSLFTIDEQAQIAAALQAAGIPTRLERVHSLAGHDAFLADQPLFAAIITRWLQDT